MDTIIYLYTKSKKQGNTTGGLSEGPPVFIFQNEKKTEYHLVFVGIPEEMLLTKEQELVPKKGRKGKEKGASTRSIHTEGLNPKLIKEIREDIKAESSGKTERKIENTGSPNQEVKHAGKADLRIANTEKLDRTVKNTRKLDIKVRDKGENDGKKEGIRKIDINREAVQNRKIEEQDATSWQGLVQYRKYDVFRRRKTSKKWNFWERVLKGKEHNNENSCSETQANTEQKGFRKPYPNKNKADWIRELYGYLRVYQLQSPACYTVCDRSVEKWLKKENLYQWWQESWPISSFVNYRETYFARELMEQAKLSHYIILGYDPYLPELLKEHVRYMKTLRFVLTSAPEEELDDFLENCYDEYGLTASVEQVEPRRGHEDTPFYGYQVKGAVPSIIIDYSNEIRLFTADLARGSLWLDMDALEEKRYRIEERNTGIEYISMKKKWKNSAYT